MRRRTFLQVAGGAALIKPAGQGASYSLDSAPSVNQLEAVQSVSGDILTYSPDDHRRRLQSLAVCERAIRACMRKHLVTNYLPGQANYNLGEYPCRKVWDPDEWDERELDRLKEHGIRLIEIHDEWNDSLRLYGGNKFTPVNPAGFRRFVQMVHSRGLKLIVYASSGFFERPDPDFRPEWARNQDLVEAYWHLAKCSPDSPRWRAYVLPHLLRIMDEYDVDGLFDDLGYRALANNPHPPTSDEVLAFPESETHDGALEDLLGLLYAEVQRRRGILKVHYASMARPATDLKVYDYLWVGEGVRRGDELREATKNYPPYVVPCLDMSRAKIEDEDELYLHTIPYLQFPYLLAGRPFTGERAMIPGIQYPPEEKDFWTHHARNIWRYYQAHPDGPYTYGWHDSVPGRPEAQPTHARWLKQYAPMVEEGTWAWLEIHESDLFPRPLPQDVVASVYANRELYLVLANYGRAPVEVATTDSYVPVEGPPDTRKLWTLGPRSLCILKHRML